MKTTFRGPTLRNTFLVPFLGLLGLLVLVAAGLLFAQVAVSGDASPKPESTEGGS